MTDTNQGVQAIIVEHQRRLQKLKEKQARLGIDTPPQVLTEIEDIENELEELEQIKEQEIGDAFLSYILAIGMITTNRVYIVLTLSGAIVSGYVIGARQFGEYILNTSMIGDGKIGVKTELVEKSNKTYIHLKDAQFYSVKSGQALFLEKSGLYWRGKLSEIESYAVNITNPIEDK